MTLLSSTDAEPPRNDHNTHLGNEARPEKCRLNYLVTDGAAACPASPCQSFSSPRSEPLADITGLRNTRMSIFSILNDDDVIPPSPSTSDTSPTAHEPHWTLSNDRRYKPCDPDAQYPLPSYREVTAQVNYPSPPYSLADGPCRASISSASSLSSCASAHANLQLRSRNKRPNFPYTTEEMDFITYHREDLQLNWQEIWPRFNEWVRRAGREDRQRGGKPGREQDGRQAVQGIYYRNKMYPVLDDQGQPIRDTQGRVKLAGVKVRQRHDENVRKHHLLAVKLIERYPRRIIQRGYDWLRPEDLEAASRQIELEESGQVQSYEKIMESSASQML